MRRNDECKNHLIKITELERINGHLEGEVQSLKMSLETLDK